MIPFISILILSCKSDEEIDTAGSQPPPLTGSSEISFVSPPPQDRELFSQDPETGAMMSRTRLVVTIKPNTANEEIINLVSSIDGSIIGGLKSSGIIFVDIFDSGNLTKIQGAVKILSNHPKVEGASEDTLLSVTSLSSETRGNSLDWTSGNKEGGNWGQKFSRFPSVWNLFDQNQDGIVSPKEINDTSFRPSTVGIVDSGFATHEDLSGLIIEDGGELGGDKIKHDHGNHVAGIIGASFNRFGINGVNPIVKMKGLSFHFDNNFFENLTKDHCIFSSGMECTETSWSRILNTTEILLTSNSENIKVLNLSMGYRWWEQLKLNANTHDKAQALVVRQSLAAERIAKQFSNVIFVVAAGNDSDDTIDRDIDSRWNSPFTFASAFVPNIIVVSATTSDGEKAGFSNSGPVLTLGAPGTNILSTILPDSATCTPDNVCRKSNVNGSYGFMSGTSMAAPMVSGLVALMYSLDPSLTIPQIKQYLTNSSSFYTDPITNEQIPILDAFSVVTQIPGISRKIADINGDSKVDAVDLSLLDQAVGNNNFPREDLNGDGIVDQSDRDFLVNLISQVNLTVTKNGTGNGTVTSDISGINCGTDCFKSYNNGTPVTLTALPDVNSDFGSFSGDCVSSTTTCTFNMSADKSVTVTFNSKSPEPTATITVGTSPLNFGNIQVGTCDTKLFTIQHKNGTAPASGSVSATAPFSISSGSNFNASNGSSAQVNVQFCPTNAGDFSGTSTVSSSATFTGSSVVTLTGMGTNPTPTQGTIRVEAKLNGADWSGNVQFSLTGPQTLSGTFVPGNVTNQLAGQWNLSYTSGGPSGATFSSISPSSSQSLLGGGSITFTLNFVLSTPVEKITNGSFDFGESGWTLSGDFWAGTNLTRYKTSPGYASGGVDSTGTIKKGAIGYMEQTITIPTSATSAILTFWLNITSDETSAVTPSDVLSVSVFDGNGTPWILDAYSDLDKDPFCNSTCTYNQKAFDLTAFKGQTIRIRFLATTNFTKDTVFRIDDVSLMADGN